MYVEVLVVVSGILLLFFAVRSQIKRAEKRAKKKAQDSFVSTVKKAFPLFDETGLNEVEHHCEWHILQERKRLHRLLDGGDDVD